MAGSVKENKTGPAAGGGGEGRRSGKTSRVKKVPDFNKLHNKWQHKMEKVEGGGMGGGRRGVFGCEVFRLK